MYKKTSKSLIFMGALLVFSLLLASCQSMLVSNEEMERNKAVEAWGANLAAQGERYLEEIERQKAVDAWGANLTAQGERYLEEIAQVSVPLIDLRSDVPPEADVMVDATSAGIKIQRTYLGEKTFLTVYTVMSDRPAWVVFHADENGLPGAILQYSFVGSGTSKIARTEDLAVIGSEQIHVMLHEDLGTIGLFEFPGPDGPVYVDNDIVNELCFCPF